MSGYSTPSMSPKPQPSIHRGIGGTTFAFALGSAVAFFTAKEGGLEYAEAADLKLVLLAITAYIFVLYVFLFRQGAGKNILNVELVNSDDPECKRHFKNLDRTAMNAMEQCPIFLAALFAYAGLVDPAMAGKLAFAYVAFLVPYPLWSPYSERTLISTVPRYFIITYMLASVVIAALRT